jgi:hypothetical protein
MRISLINSDNATAFALLVLCRANLLEDLSTNLKGKVRDPGTSKLRSPGDLNDLLNKGAGGTTGTKTGPGTTAPKADPPGTAGAGKLAAAVVAATGDEREALLAKYRDSKGAEYTDALALAIPQLTGQAKTQARDALARRATRFTAGTLTGMMTDPDPELRRVAALAAGGKGRDRLGEFADGLVKLTADRDPLVVQAARASLKALTGEDFGPESGATPADRTRAFTAWQNWLAKNKSK